MKVIFLRAYDFPLGGAPQNRLLGICRGLIEHGVDVEVHQYAPAKLNLKPNLKESQIYKGVSIFNHSWKWSPLKTKKDRVFGLLFGITNSILAIYRSHKQKQISFVFINAEKNIYLFPFFLLSRLIGAKFGRDLNEYPSTILFPQKHPSIIRKYKLLTNYRWFDIIIVMTKNLELFYKNYTKRKTFFFHLPMTVDIDRFPKTVQNHEKLLRITYCGDLSQTKDGVVTLINSFAIIEEEFPDLQLWLIGETKDKEHLIRLKKLVSKLSLDSKIIFTGFVNPENIPNELYKSRLLVLSRPDSQQAKGGFPTKLGEYLATGVPVVVTSVGELPLYLNDEENAFLAKPDSIESFADAIRRALLNSSHSKKVGLRGRDIAIMHFSHRTQGLSLSTFLKSVSK